MVANKKNLVSKVSSTSKANKVVAKSHPKLQKAQLSKKKVAVSAKPNAQLPLSLPNGNTMNNMMGMFNQMMQTIGMPKGNNVPFG